jgi:hypothetical protein
MPGFYFEVSRWFACFTLPEMNEISAVVPTYNSECDLDKTLLKLSLQKGACNENPSC